MQRSSAAASPARERVCPDSIERHLHRAGSLVRRLERQYGVRVTRAVAAPLRPVLTTRASLPEDRPDTGRLMMISGMAQFGETESRNETASAMSLVVIILSAGTISLANSDMSVSTKPGQIAVAQTPEAPSSFWVDPENEIKIDLEKYEEV